MDKELRQHFQGKKALVTGASGYLASALVPALQVLGSDVVLSSRSPLSTLPGTTWVNYADRSALQSALHACDYVFHLAAQTSVKIAQQDPSTDLETNVGRPLHLLEAARSSPRKTRLVLAGTATVVGTPAQSHCPDEHPAAPVTIYDLHKSMLEQHVKLFAAQEAVTAVVLRLANVYGPGKTSAVADRGILQRVCRAALSGQKIPVFGTGQYIRDYVFIEDVVQAFLRAAVHAEALAGKACFVATGEGRSLQEAFQEVVQQANALTGRKAELELNPAARLQAIDLRNFVGEARLLREQAGWTPHTSFAKGVALTLKGLS